MPQNLFLPTELPWSDLKGKDLEELLYWLFDAMGAKDLDWRVGGTGPGTSDQGRDLECSFYISTPDGELVKQRWWIEAKGRASTVDPLEVKNAVINAAGKSGLDVLVIATNSVFSNPTRDWVIDWQKQHPTPKVKLWERSMLENLCSKNPIAVVRLFKKALSPQGKLEVAKTKLWDYAALTDDPTLCILWKERHNLSIDGRALVALTTSEMANGNIQARSWAAFVDESVLVSSLGNGLINFLYLVFRANESGIRQLPLIKALAYLTLVCVARLGAELTSQVLGNVWETVSDREYPDQIRRIILQPVIQLLYNEVRDVCTSDCLRVSSERLVLTEEEVEHYWRRIHISDAEASEDRQFLVIEAHDVPCRVGFSLNRENGCPLISDDYPEENVARTLEVIRAVTGYRSTESKR